MLTFRVGGEKLSPFPQQPASHLLEKRHLNDIKLEFRKLQATGNARFCIEMICMTKVTSRSQNTAQLHQLLLRHREKLVPLKKFKRTMTELFHDGNS